MNSISLLKSNAKKLRDIIDDLDDAIDEVENELEPVPEPDPIPDPEPEPEPTPDPEPEPIEVNPSELHVSKAGDSNGSGSSDSPFASIQQAIDNATPGDSIIVHGGHYDEALTWRNARSGHADGRIALKAADSAEVSFNRMTINRAFWDIEGFKLTAVEGIASLVAISNGAHHLVFRGNTIDGAKVTGAEGILMSRSGEGPQNEAWPSYCLFEGNLLTRIQGATAITMSGRENVFRKNIVEDLYSGDMVRLFGQQNLVHGNTFRDIHSIDGIGFHPDFVQSWGHQGIGSLNHVIERNQIINLDSQISQIVEASLTRTEYLGAGLIGGWIFRNNIYANTRLGGSNTVPGQKYFNNVFYRCNYSGGHALSFGCGIKGCSQGARVFNNVFLDCGDSRTNSGWYGFLGAPDQEFDYNFVAKLNYGPVRERDPRETFRWWEDHGINGGDPLFFDEENLDFRLQEGSPLIGAGKMIEGFTDNIVGQQRGEKWNIGVF
jgi:hypothetical protein